MKIMHHANVNKKKTGLALLLSDKVHFRKKKITRHKKSIQHCTVSPSHCKKTSKRNKRCTYQKERNKTAPTIDNMMVYIGNPKDYMKRKSFQN